MAQYLIKGETLIGIADAIRSKTGSTDSIPTTEMAAQIEGISGGGGSSADLRYVTFMSHDGTVELGKKAVAVGDDCADPIARGVFDTPTRESDVQYNYTHVGWANTPGGGWDENILKAITEDKTVYAAYAAAVRYYTISFYDGDTLLTTKQVAYGGSSNYTPPAKDGYFFSAWNPAPENITGDMNCYAQYKMDIDFATASWADIAAVSEAGEAESYFSVGDKKTMSIALDSGTIDMEVLIAGFNHDSLATDNSKKAGISIVCNRVINSIPTMWAAYDDDKECWKTMYLRTYLNETVVAALPDGLQAVLKPVTKLSDPPYLGGNTLNETEDKLWLLSVAEAGLEASLNSSYTLTGQGTVYEYFKAGGQNSRRIPYVGGNAANFAAWYTRSLYRNRYKYMNVVSTLGQLAQKFYKTGTSTTEGIVFGFCI